MSSTRLDQQEEPLLAEDDFDTDDENDPSAMSLVDHLEELRWRIFKAIIAILVGGVFAFIFIGIVLFAVGISLGYIVLRYPIEWLVTFAAGSFTELVTADSYFGFVAFFILAFGIVFELPLVLTFLAKVGIVSGEMLKEKR